MFSIISLMINGEYMLAVLSILTRCFVVFCCLPIHEFAHGWAAYKLGDDTAKLQGRLTLNPFAHLNPIGTIMIFLFGIGYADPVPVNANRFKKPKRDMAITALAGPLSNVLMAFISVTVYIAMLRFFDTDTGVAYAVSEFFYLSASINAVLAVFNLLPIPPLDGSKILAAVLPYRQYVKYMQYERYFMIALFILLFTGVLDTAISALATALIKLLAILPSLIFSIG